MTHDMHEQGEGLTAAQAEFADALMRYENAAALYPQGGPVLGEKRRRVLDLFTRASNGASVESPEYGAPVRYLTDDRDTKERQELVIQRGGNGDYYVSVVPEGERTFRGVRICTSGGAASRFPKLVAAIADAYRTLHTNDAGVPRLSLRDELRDLDVARTAAPSDGPWTLEQAATVLAAAADHYLSAHDCDHDGYENVMAARDAVRTLQASPATKTDADADWIDESLGYWAEGNPVSPQCRDRLRQIAGRLRTP